MAGTSVLVRGSEAVTGELGLPAWGTEDTHNPLSGTVFTDTLRGVRCVRLSVLTDETTSPERQREACDHVAGELRITFGEGAELREAVDLDVSASKTSPWERPELLRWLHNPAAYDALVFWRFDRAIRSMAHMYALANWAREHRKVLVFAEGLGGGRQVFDFRNPMDPMAELQLFMLAFAAQFEAQSISDRVSGAQAAMRRMPLRWRGSRPPYGYTPAPMPEEFGGVGFTLMPDPDAVRVIERIIRELLEGATVSAVAAGLNADDVLSPRDYWADNMGRKRGGKTGGAKGQHVVRKTFKWTPAVITRMLRSEVLIGWKLHNGKPVRDDQGNPVMCTPDPILTREEFDRIGAVLDERSIENGERSDTEALLLRVIHCDSCGGRMYLNRQESKKNQAPVYKCNHHARGDKCEAPSNVRGDWADDHVEAEFLRLVGPIRTKTVVEVPGYDPAPELNATVAEFAEHQKQQGRQRSRHAAAEWQKRADALDNRMAELESREKTEPTRVVTETGRTYADDWAAADLAGRRRMLIEAGVRLDVKRGTRGGWRTLDVRRVTFTIAGELDPAVEELAGLRTEPSATPETDPAEGARVRLAEPVGAAA
ncbi:recombinase family protein [Kitasatospora misakiensis]|uniref:Recombinase family protein n=1 Tax=Kitasatospora misakiensis TaxID=67330 RepID=A0ABW0X8R0_9ACTN